MKEITSYNEIQTKKIGEKIGQKAKLGDIFVLIGDLGAGKTVFSQGLAKGLGIKEKVNSPTFNLLKIYPFKKQKQLCHIDAYRLKKWSDFQALGWTEFLEEKRSILVVEWGDKFIKNFPPQTKIIKIKNISETKRKILFFDFDEFILRKK